MRLFLLASSLLILLVGPQAAAAANKKDKNTAAIAETTCAVCDKTKLAAKEFQHDSEKGLASALAVFETYQGSKNPETLGKEIGALLELAALTLPKNDEGQIDDLLYDVYRDHKKEIDEHLKKMGDKDRKIIQDSLDHMAKVSDEGNG